jgi:hypothetical protein
MSADDPLERLLSRYFDGELDAHGVAELEGRLIDDANAPRRAAEWCLAHRQITDVLSEDRLHDLIDQMLVGRPGPPREVFEPRTLSSPSAGRRLVPRAAWALSLATIATAAAIVFAIFRPLDWRPANGPGGKNSPQEANVTASTDPVPFEFSLQPGTSSPRTESHSIASLAQVIDVVWESPEATLESGQDLLPGSHVRLRSGRAKVTFDCGAEVVLEGPCDFELQNKMVGLLHAGRLTADVPKRAFGFGVLCPGVDLVDLGTSFGVSVQGGAQTELHVFEGEVLCSPNEPDTAGARRIVHVRENEAMSFTSGASDSADLPLDTVQFASLRSVRRSDRQAPEGMTADELALWLAADTGVVTDAKGRVISWSDRLYGDNRSAEDALQAEAVARPLLAKDAINGQPAVRFDGESDFLLTTPLQTIDDQTVVLVCQFSDAALNPDRRWGGQILNYDGPPSRYLSDTLEPGVLQIGEPLLESQFKPTLISGQVFAGFVGETTVESGRVDAAPAGVGAPTIVAYTYNYTQGRAELRVNGRLAGVSRAFAPQEVTSRKIIGRHAWMALFYCGDLSEMLIYNKALSAEELDATSLYLSRKYAIPMSEADLKTATPLNF